MAITVPFDLGYEFEVKAKAQDVFALLADVPASASHFPKLAKLVDLGDHSYRWEMEKVGTASMNIQTIYASHYVADKKKGTVVWTPVEGEGNALMVGRLLAPSCAVNHEAQQVGRQGKEMLMHKKLSEQTGIAVYFCDPHSPWQRGSNENMNGLVRQYLPKGTDLSIYSQEQLDAIADEINHRPRKGLGVRSPLAVYRELLVNSPQHSTLIH